MRKVIVVWTDARSGECTEPFVEGERGSFPVGHADPEQWARECIARFNATLRPGETARVILSVRTEDLDAKETSRAEIQHRWEKTNLITIDNGRERMHDTAKCAVCGITGKRFGLSDVTRDKKFAAQGYDSCNGAQKLLARKAARG